MLCAMVVRAKDITRMHARPPTPTSKAEAKDGEEKFAATYLAATMHDAHDYIHSCPKCTKTRTVQEDVHECRQPGISVPLLPNR